MNEDYDPFENFFEFPEHDCNFEHDYPDKKENSEPDDCNDCN